MCFPSLTICTRNNVPSDSVFLITTYPKMISYLCFCDHKFCSLEIRKLQNVKETTEIMSESGKAKIDFYDVR